MVEAVSFQGHLAQWQTLNELLQQDRLPHAMAFVGPTGIGKRQVALALAKAASCPKESVLQLAPSGTMLKLEQAQEILSFLSLRSLSQRRFIVVDDAHLMNASFANALLKILEEPPAHTHFVFLLPAISQLLPTVRSRLQAVRFSPLKESCLWDEPEALEFKDRGVQVLIDLANARRDGLEKLAAEIKERSSAEWLARVFQQYLRDAVVDRQNEWASRPKRQILQVWKEAFQLQQDIAANLDRPLLFENFYLRGRKILENANG
jgi:DNA polymerase-3 subunit delta'